MDSGVNSLPPRRGRGRGGHPRLNQRPVLTPAPSHGTIGAAARTRRPRAQQGNNTWLFFHHFKSPLNSFHAHLLPIR
jgi:hypothetical protein